MLRPPSLLLVLPLALACAAPAQQPSREQILDGMHKAARFFREDVSTEGGYQFRYAADLSFGRSEHASGPTQVSVQRDGTPRVGMAYLEAWDATQDRFYLDAAKAAAMALVEGQLCSGGWDYIVEFEESKRAPYRYRVDGCAGDGEAASPTNLDDNTSQAALRLMMRVDRETGFAEKPIHDSALYALAALERAQYPNGAWPQRYYTRPDPKDFPVKKASYPESWSRKWPGDDYSLQYTLNDNSLADLIDAFLEAARIYNEPRYAEVAMRGGEFLLLAQMPDPQPAWAQQYDRDMHPAWARIFEPPSVTGGESQSAMRILLTLYRETGDKRFLEPIPRALAYLRSSGLPPDPNPPARKRRACPPGTLCLARFYELQTNKGLFITKGTRVSAAGLGSLRADGYEVTYDDSDPIQHYGMWISGRGLDAIEAEYERLRDADPSAIRRPDKLHGLSPWSGDGVAKAGDSAALLAAMDDRGAWVENGVAGRADSVAAVYAAEPMVIRIGDRTIPLPEDETVEVFRGSAPVVEKMILSATFAHNLEALAAALRR
ncbi:MAG: pectate lyase [Bryobacterales bacterium]